MDRRAIETLALARALGPRRLARAVGRRIGAEIRARAAPAAMDARACAAALRVGPSPLAEDGDEQRLHDLEAARPGICARIRQRAEAACLEDAPPVSGDPRRSWESGRLARLVAIGAGARVAENAGATAEATALRTAGERIALAWIEAHPRSSWASPLEVAIRAWNLWTAVSFFRPERIEPRALAVIAGTLVEHGLDLEARLEDRGVVVGSHLLGELVGLYACGTAL